MTGSASARRSTWREIWRPIAARLASAPAEPDPEAVQDKLLQMACTEDRLREQRETLVRLASDAAAAREAAEAASSAKSGFLADMSHELRTPLNAIIGITEILVEDAQDAGNAELLEPLERVLNAGQHLLRLINDVLDLSKIEAGKMQLAIETIDLTALLSDVVATATPLAEKNDNRLILRSADNPQPIEADPLRLRQVLLNLVSNACKFTKAGEVGLSVSFENRPDGRHLVLTVTDSGIGMTPEHIGRLFQEYAQADAHTARDYGGTGLGLVISLRLARLMGGDIAVASQIGKGSAFTLRLPVAGRRAAGPCDPQQPGVQR